jgi:hypothetical protein
MLNQPPSLHAPENQRDDERERPYDRRAQRSDDGEGPQTFGHCVRVHGCRDTHVPAYQTFVVEHLFEKSGKRPHEPRKKHGADR